MSAEDTSLGKRKVPKVLQVQQADLGVTDKWWQNMDEQEGDGSKKWTYLEHHGVQFPAEYKSKGLTIHFEGNPLKLTPLQEELVFYWCQSLGTDWETKEEYRNNFAKVLAASLGGDAKYEKIEMFDFQPIIDLIHERKEEHKAELAERKNWTPEQKMQLKTEKEQKDAKYGYAIVDFIREKLGGYTIEPPTLFKGRGVHPKSGCFKPRTYPEDVTINIAEEAPVPRCTVPGRAWKDIVHNPNVTWLAFYKDEVINNGFKYFFLSANSKLKAINDVKKYEKARRLKNEINRIRQDYMDKVGSKGSYEKQLGTVTYFIDKLALRVGNEKNEEEEADTVGCCSLRVEHITLHPENTVKFDFLGKDSMRYENEVQVDPLVFANLSLFIKGKQPGEDLFDKVNPSRLNDYLSGLMENLTAKVFRTFNASFTLDKQLNETVPEPDATVDEKFKFYTEANKKVAILCNHQKTVNKDFDVRLQKYQDKIQELEDYLSQLREHLALLKKGKKGLKSEDEIPESSVAKIKKKFPLTADATKTLITKMSERIQTEKLRLEEKTETRNVSLGTSKINYNDPRISVAWCKRHNVPIERVFSKELRAKFTWAMSIEPLWKF
jgi:DNA topoisomerase-1